MIVLYFAMLLGAAALSGWWVLKGLRQGEMWLLTFFKANKRDQPALYWLAIWSQTLTTVCVLGIAAVLLWWTSRPV